MWNAKICIFTKNVCVGKNQSHVFLKKPCTKYQSKSPTSNNVHKKCTQNKGNVLVNMRSALF